MFPRVAILCGMTQLMWAWLQLSIHLRLQPETKAADAGLKDTKRWGKSLSKYRKEKTKRKKTLICSVCVHLKPKELYCPHVCRVCFGLQTNTCKHAPLYDIDPRTFWQLTQPQSTYWRVLFRDNKVSCLLRNINLFRAVRRAWQHI